MRNRSVGKNLLPGKHYDAPPNKEIEDFYKQWNESKEDKRKIFTDFMIKNVNISKVDEFMMIIGIVAPPAAMVAKKTRESVPQLSVMKATLMSSLCPQLQFWLSLLLKSPKE